jgi:hypothetical protein
MSSPVNMSNVDAMGAQFKNNVFKTLAVGALKKSKGLAALAKRQAGKPTVPTGVVSGSKTTNFRTTKTGPRQPVGALPAAPTPQAVSSGVQGHPALPPGRSITTPFTPGATVNSYRGSNIPALPAGKYRGITTPTMVGHSPIPMSSNAALTNRVSPTVKFSDTTSQNPVNRTAFNQPSQTPFKVNTISNPAPIAKPTAQPAQQFSSMPKPDFPLHVPPAGSSQQTLPRLTAAQSQPGKPNNFVVGSRNAKAEA